MTASRFLLQCERFGQTRTIFRFPYLHVAVQSERFAGLVESEREAVFAQALKLNIAEVRSATSRAMLILRLLTPSECDEEYPKSGDDSRGFHWLAQLAEAKSPISRLNTGSRGDPAIVHFYGYKGGQARSTLLALTSLALADDGWRVLSIDADIEAPSLDILYGRTSYSVAGTLLGVEQGAKSITPERVYTSPAGNGFVNFLACRPRSSEFDLDATAFALRTSLDPGVVSNIAQVVYQAAVSQNYHAVLLDHRSGLSVATPTWLHLLGGPTVICTRLDEQWRSARTFLQLILRTYPPVPGVFVSWKPDEEPEDSFRRRNNAQVDELLEALAEVMRESANGDAEVSSIEVADHLLVWPYDSAFRQSRLPTPSQLSRLTVERVGELRRILGVGSRIASPAAAQGPLSPSGSRDEGDLIETDALRQLIAPTGSLFSTSSISYIFGRKGTGKTRLLRELARLSLGEPLLVAADSKEGLGLKSNSPELSEAVARFRSDPEAMWWHLLGAAISLPTTAENELRMAFTREIAAPSVPRIQLPEAVKGRSRVFLVDGLETAFSAQDVFAFVEGLFKFLLTIETDSRLSQHIQFKLFLRTDLAERGYQNIEQQVSGRAIRLSWNTTKIFNFLLSRVPKKAWFCNTFGELVERIRDKHDSIRKGALDIEECEELLLMAFPESLRRNNLSTMTFLRTYFADSATDTQDRLAYYPRIFDTFLDVIDRAQTDDGNHYHGEPLEAGRISQGLIIFAHEEAAIQYLKQLRSELNYLVVLAGNSTDNESRVQDLLNAFEGLSTPFDLEEQVSALASRVPLSESAVRSAMERMKRMGMFEVRPGYPGQWRVGRLFKSSLKMKYVR